MDRNSHPHVGVLVWDEIKRRGITPSDLAKSAGVARSTLYDWKSQKTTPRPSELKRVADELDMNYEQLLAMLDGRESFEDYVRSAIGRIEANLQEVMADMAAIKLDYIKTIIKDLRKAQEAAEAWAQHPSPTDKPAPPTQKSARQSG